MPADRDFYCIILRQLMSTVWKSGTIVTFTDRSIGYNCTIQCVYPTTYTLPYNISIVSNLDNLTIDLHRHCLLFVSGKIHHTLATLTYFEELQSDSKWPKWPKHGGILPDVRATWPPPITKVWWNHILVKSSWDWTFLNASQIVFLGAFRNVQWLQVPRVPGSPKIF